MLLLRGKAARGGERVLSGCCIKGSLFKVGIYLFLAMLGCHCCMRTFSGCDNLGYSLVAVCGLFVVVYLFVAEPQLWDTTAAVVAVPRL